MPEKTLYQTVEDIQNQISFHTKSLIKLREFSEKNIQIDKFYKTFNKDFSLDDISSFKTQLNFAGFITTSILDLLVITKSILLSNLFWERVYNFKAAYLIIYEAIQTYHRHKEIFTLLGENLKNQELHEIISNELKSFKREYDYPNVFKSLRNSTIAHVEPDFKIYYEALNEIDGDKCFNSIISFLQIIYKMQTLSRYFSEALVLQENGQEFNKEKLMKELKEKINKRMNILTENR